MRFLMIATTALLACAGTTTWAQTPPPHLSYPRFALVRVYVADLARGAAFYQNVFDMHDGSGSNAHEKVLAFADPATPVLVLSNAIPPAGGDLTPFAVIVPDLDMVLARAGQYGGTIVQPARSLGAYGRIAFVKDTAGNRIEVLEPPKAQ